MTCMKFATLLVLLFLLSLTACAQWFVRYQPHDPNSYCLERGPELRLRPAVICTGADCTYAGTLELHWKCKRWSSW
jgi:hypothetical protein